MKTENNLKFEPEKLSLWDRLFNRYRKVVIEEGQESWKSNKYGLNIDIYTTYYYRNFVKYAIVDRLTGSVTIELDYLN